MNRLNTLRDFGIEGKRVSLLEGGKFQSQLGYDVGIIENKSLSFIMNLKVPGAPAS